MGVRGSLVRKEKRGEKLHPVFVIDFRYRDPEGRERRYRRDARLQTAAGARKEAERLFALALETGSVEIRSDAPTFGAFVEGTFTRLYMPRYRPATRTRYEELLGQGILATFGAKCLDAIETRALRAFVVELHERRVQPRGPLNFVRTVMRAAVESGVLATLPEFPKLPRPGRKLPDAPSTEEVRAMLTHATGWLRVAVALAAYAGLRMGEVRALEVRDVDLDGARILVRRAYSGDEVLSPKSTHERVVPIAAMLVDYVREAMRDKLPTALVVVNERGRTPGRTLVLNRLKALQRKHGLRERSFHSLRHHFCSELVSAGVGAEAVRVLAGHASLTVTQQYVHASAGELRAAIAKLPGN
jgi:integrase